MAPQIKSYQYFDTPDGQDVFKKLWCVMKPAGLVSIGLGTCDVVAHSYPKTYIQALGRYAYIGTAILVPSATFVLTTNALASMRKKDDKINWFVGGFASGASLGALTRKTIIGFNCGMFFGILAVCRKIAADNNWNVTPPNDIPFVSQGAWDFDFTLTKHRPGNWTTGE